MNKLLRMGLPLLCVVSLAAIGCGDDDDDDDVTSSTSNDDGSTSGTPSPSPADMTVEITAVEYKLTPAQITAKTGQRVTFMLHNAGTMPHDLEVELPSGDIELDTDVEPGGVGEMTSTMPSSPGSFEYYCPIPGHKDLGMVGTLTVEAAAPPTGY